ncbi:hypothetical protein K488DRAFT_74387 [Vararia minispora EC-137]|uniref:Uncharacterized protein n=1 Tax=Vararia minispora EC-137 TaxID=1314806 RepID=A0ACB8Q7L2_9AGAM|nr:hypothetical protein K488DRAFT_74387 [Vararia minispora EC-137]
MAVRTALERGDRGGHAETDVGGRPDVGERPMLNRPELDRAEPYLHARLKLAQWHVRTGQGISGYRYECIGIRKIGLRSIRWKDAPSTVVDAHKGSSPQIGRESNPTGICASRIDAQDKVGLRTYLRRWGPSRILLSVVQSISTSVSILHSQQFVRTSPANRGARVGLQRYATRGNGNRAPAYEVPSLLATWEPRPSVFLVPQAPVDLPVSAGLPRVCNLRQDSAFAGAAVAASRPSGISAWLGEGDVLVRTSRVSTRASFVKRFIRATPRARPSSLRVSAGPYSEQVSYGTEPAGQVDAVTQSIPSDSSDDTNAITVFLEVTEFIQHLHYTPASDSPRPLHIRFVQRAAPVTQPPLSSSHGFVEAGVQANVEGSNGAGKSSEEEKEQCDCCIPTPRGSDGEIDPDYLELQFAQRLPCECHCHPIDMSLLPPEI